MDPFDYLRILRRRWPLVAVAAALALAGAWLTLPDEPTTVEVDRPRQYTADHVLYRDGSGGGDAQVRLETVALLASSGQVPHQVAERLGEEGNPAVLAGEVTITGDDKLGTVTVSTTQEDPERAVLLVDTFGEELLAHFDGEAEVRRRARIDQLQKHIAELEEQVLALGQRLPGRSDEEENAAVALQRGEFEAVLSQRNTTIAQLKELQGGGPASIGLRTLQAGVAFPVLENIENSFQPPSSPAARLVIGALLGLALGTGLAVMIDRVDTRLRGRREVERAFGLPVVTDIPRLRPAERRDHAIVMLTHPASFAAEAYRVLRLSVQLMPRWILPLPNPSSTTERDALAPAPSLTRRRIDEPARVVLVTSPNAGAGKSTTVVNLAASFAEVGKVVLILDCDFRYPQMHRFFGLDVERGVTEFLHRAGSDPVPLRGRHLDFERGVSEFLHPRAERPPLSDLVWHTWVPGVWIVPAGAPPANPGELIDPDQELISAAAELADVILVDTGPLLAVNDPAALMPRADAVVVVARSGRTTVDEAARSSELLARLEAPVLGVALVGSPRPGRGSNRYYSQRPVVPVEAPPSPHTDPLRKAQP